MRHLLPARFGSRRLVGRNSPDLDKALDDALIDALEAHTVMST